ncbi:MAG: hypothetical protein FWG84_03375 [Bacteroidales bacterium]|nr:hypothetical protein [Bacteroidales bacterium]
MATLAIKYNPKNMVVTKFLEALTLMKGVEMLERETLTAEEMERVEMSRNSEIHTDIVQLKNILRSKL